MAWLKARIQIIVRPSSASTSTDKGEGLANKAKRNVADHKASPSEQRLAEALKVMIEEVGGTIAWAKDKLDSFPKAKKDLVCFLSPTIFLSGGQGPLLDALGQPLTQIVGGVGLLLAGVLNLVGKLLSGLGLDGLLKGIVSATASLPFSLNKEQQAEALG